MLQRAACGAFQCRPPTKVVRDSLVVAGLQADQIPLRLKQADTLIDTFQYFGDTLLVDIREDDSCSYTFIDQYLFATPDSATYIGQNLLQETA